MLYQIILFFKAARMISLFQGPPNISWHRAPKELGTALMIVPMDYDIMNLFQNPYNSRPVTTL